MSAMDLVSPPIPGPDGLIHPADEAEVAALVRYAAAHGRRLRVRGAGHSPPGGFAGDRPDDLVLSLGAMRSLSVLDMEGRIVEAQAGIHIGADPLAPEEEGAPTQALLNQLADRYGWTVSSTGGISHQALGGFLSTGSAGGSLQHSLLDHVLAVRLIDGRGEVREFRADGDAPGLAPVLPSLGLLGVVVSVTLRCEPMFAIVGQEAIVDLAGASIDLEGPGNSGRPSLADFLTRAEYARIDWWPQRGAERLLIWQAQRVALQPGFRPTRYEEFTRYPILAEALFSTLYVIFGNQTAPARIAQLLRRNATEVAHQLDLLTAQGQVSRRRRWRLGALPLAMRGLAALAPGIRLLRPLLTASLPWLVPTALGIVLPLDEHKRGMERGEPQSFRDWAWEGLPMDDQANDVLMWTQFIELWVPLTRASELVRVVREYFAAPADARESYERTGLYAYELYGAPPAAGWIHPGYSDGSDAWSEGALRLDIFWFTDNLEDPRERFYPQFWELLSAHGIPFRSHWGKELPNAADYPDLLADGFPHWEDWLALRAECDPDDVFLTDYWRARLGLK
jgi:D-arabinono-1,4-lactone oxidase